MSDEPCHASTLPRLNADGYKPTMPRKFKPKPSRSTTIIKRLSRPTTIKRLCAVTGWNRTTVRKYLKNGTIPNVKLGRFWRVCLDTLQEAVDC